jgi:hypothetical protein
MKIGRFIQIWNPSFTRFLYFIFAPPLILNLFLKQLATVLSRWVIVLSTQTQLRMRIIISRLQHCSRKYYPIQNSKKLLLLYLTPWPPLQQHALTIQLAPITSGCMLILALSGLIQSLHGKMAFILTHTSPMLISASLRSRQPWMASTDWTLDWQLCQAMGTTGPILWFITHHGSQEESTVRSIIATCLEIRSTQYPLQSSSPSKASLMSTRPFCLTFWLTLFRSETMLSTLPSTQLVANVFSSKAL